jgi:hypothetical protein
MRTTAPSGPEAKVGREAGQRPVSESPLDGGHDKQPRRPANGAKAASTETFAPDRSGRCRAAGACAATSMPTGRGAGAKHEDDNGRVWIRPV